MVVSGMMRRNLEPSAGGASDKDVKDLLQELHVLMNIGRHDNIINLLGCCVEEGGVCVIWLCSVW